MSDLTFGNLKEKGVFNRRGHSPGAAVPVENQIGFLAKDHIAFARYCNRWGLNRASIYFVASERVLAFKESPIVYRMRGWDDRPDSLDIEDALERCGASVIEVEFSVLHEDLAHLVMG